MSEYVQVEGMPYLFTRNGLYGLRRPENKYRWESFGTRERELAIVEYGQRRGAVPDTRSGKTQEQAWEAFLAEELTKPATMAKHKTTYRTHIEKLVHGPVEAFDRSFVNRVLDVAEKTVSKKTKRPLSTSMLRAIKSTLGAFGEHCIAEGWLKTNPAHTIKARKWMASDIRSGKSKNVVENRVVELDEIVSQEELDKILQGLGDYADSLIFRYRMFVQLMPLIGTRINECLALLLSDVLVDDDRGMYGEYGSIYVGRQIGYRFVADDPRTWFDDLLKHGGKPRRVPLDEFSRPLLDTYIERGMMEGWLQRGGLLLPNSFGRPFQSAAIGRVLRKATRKVGLRDIVSHQFRHTYASELFAGGIPVVEVAKLLGNDPKVCEDVYVHFIKQGSFADRVAAARRAARGLAA